VGDAGKFVTRALRVLTTREVNVNHTVTQNTPGSWRDAALAGLPHVLFALALYAPLLTYDVTAHGLAVFFEPLREYTRNSDTFPRFWLRALLQAFWALTVILTVVGLWRGLPRWSASWIGYALHGLMGMLGLIPGYTPALALSWLALIVGVVFWLSRRDPLTGLLAVLPLAPMLVWLIQMDMVISTFEGFVYLPAGLLVAVAVAIAVRRGNFWVGLSGALTVILLAGLPIAYSVVHFQSPGFKSEIGLNEVIRLFFNDLFIFATVGVPVWLLLAWRGWRRMQGTA
jgi:hypothetical protein